MAFKIYALVTGELASTVDAMLLNGGPQGYSAHGFDSAIPLPDGSTFEGLKIPVPAFLVVGGNKTILIDTGMGDALALSKIFVDRNYPIYCYKKPEWDMGAQLRKFNAKPANIDIVFHTHLHFDHITNNHLFKRASFFAHPNEKQWAINPPHHFGAGPYYPEFSHHVEEILPRLMDLDDEGELMPGFSYFHAGGHSPGSLVVQVQTDKGIVTIAGDVMFNYVNIEQNWPLDDQQKIAPKQRAQ